MASGDWGDGGAGGSWGGGDSGDSFSERSSQGWFSRLGRALVGIPIGIALFLVSFVLLFWNEGRAVRTAKGLAEGKSSVVSVAADRVEPGNEGKLVHIAGGATTSDDLRDPLFGVAARAIRLRRVVRMYQWVERAETRTRKRVGGGEDRITTYEYNRDWSDRPIDSSSFKKREGHENPSDWPFQKWEADAPTVTLGAFTLPPSLVTQIDDADPLPVDEATRSALPESVGAGLKLDAGRLYRGDDPANPQVGDMTIAFEVVRPQVVSLLAQQAGKSLAPFATASGSTINRLQRGDVPASEMFRQAEAENTVVTWVLRLFGFLVMAVGIALATSIVSTLADVIPFLGDLVGLGTGFFAIGSALVLSLTTIAIGWIAFRPLVGVAVLAVAGLILLAFLKAGRGRRATRPATP